MHSIVISFLYTYCLWAVLDLFIVEFGNWHLSAVIDWALVVLHWRFQFLFSTISILFYWYHGYIFSSMLACPMVKWSWTCCDFCEAHVMFMFKIKDYVTSQLVSEPLPCYLVFSALWQKPTWRESERMFKAKQTPKKTLKTLMLKSQVSIICIISSNSIFFLEHLFLGKGKKPRPTILGD